MSGLLIIDLELSIMLPGEPNPFWFIWIPLLILRSCSHLKCVYANENRWPFCSCSTSLHFWFIIFNWYICFWTRAPKLQLTLGQCCFHFALRCTAFESVSYDLENPSWSLFLQCPFVWWHLLLTGCLPYMNAASLSSLLSLESVCVFLSQFFFTHRNNWATSVVLLKPSK